VRSIAYGPQIAAKVMEKMIAAEHPAITLVLHRASVK
jgi:hypothetical protein